MCVVIIIIIIIWGRFLFHRGCGVREWQVRAWYVHGCVRACMGAFIEVGVPHVDVECARAYMRRLRG